MKRIQMLFIAATSVVMLAGCVAIFSPKKQTVAVNTGNSKATLYVDDDNRGSGDVVETKVTKDLKAKQLKVEAPGYKPSYYAIMQHKMNPLACVSCILVVPSMFDNVDKSYSYSSSFECPLTTKRIVRKADQKYISVDEVSFDVKSKDYQFKYISYSNYLKRIEREEEKDEEKKEKGKFKNKNTEEIKVDNTVFTEQLEDVLKSTGFIDTVNMIFRDNQNSLSLRANVKSLNFYEVMDVIGNRVLNFYITRSDVKWDVLNSYGEVLKTLTVKSQSGEFVIDYSSASKDKQFKAMFADMIENSLDQVLTNPSISGLVTMEQGSTEAKLPLTSITKPTSYIKAAADAQNSTVIVKTNDGHGSGFAITNDGYIITNYHVVASEDPTKQNDVTVILGDGSKLKATIVKYSKAKDLALLKIDHAFDNCFELPTQKNFSVLEEVFVMGAPKSIELGQSAAKGIISSERNVNNVNLIQTSISVSPGNSGGPMFSKDGKLYGVVVSKLIGRGAEGVAFCVPAYKILDFLNLELK